MKKLLSWKTTVAGVGAVIPQLLLLLFPKVITSDIANAISGLMVSLGLIAAKDSNVTGGSKTQGGDTPPIPPPKP